MVADRKLAVMHRRARILLMELGIEPRRLKMVSNLPYLVLECEMPHEPVRISFPLNKLGRRVLREIYHHWLPGIDCGTIKPSHVLDLMLIFAPTSIVYRYRSRIRRRTGLIRDPKLRNYVIWHRIKATKRFKKRKSPRGSLACSFSSPSRRDGGQLMAFTSSEPGRDKRRAPPKGPLAPYRSNPPFAGWQQYHQLQRVGHRSAPRGPLARDTLSPSRKGWHLVRPFQRAGQSSQGAEK